MTQDIVGFDYVPRTRVLFGDGAINRIGILAKECGLSRVLIVTDSGICAAGHVEKVLKVLSVEGLVVEVFDGVRENPTTLDVDRCLEVARTSEIDGFIGLGGGSAMDTAKGTNFLFTNGGSMADYWGVGKAKFPMLPMIAVPTTAGTGSECQSFALIADENSHQKMACGDPKAAPRIALLDPELTVTQPKAVTAATGMDAIVHAVETAVTLKRNSISLLFSRESFRLTSVAFPTVLRDPENLIARGAMILGAAYAGIAIENSMLGAAHSAANPLTSQFGVIHGHAVGVMLPHVVRFNAENLDASHGYLALASHAGLVASDSDPEEAVDALINFLVSILKAAEIPTRLGAWSVTEETVKALAESAASQWTATFNPRTITSTDFEDIYRKAL